MRQKRTETDPKICPDCGISFNRRKREGVKEYVDRIFCSRTCAQKNNWFKKQARTQPSPKTCIVCGNLFSRISQSLCTFKKQKCCSTQCYKKISAIHLSLCKKKKRVELPPKTCAICGESFVRRKQEKIHQFNSRKYCSLKCSSQDKLLFFGHRKWSEREDRIIIEKYPKLGKDRMCELLKGRTINAIKSRATFLDIRLSPEAKHEIISKSATRWSEEEDRILKKYYPETGTENLTLALPSKSIQSIKGRISKLGLRMKKEAIGKVRRDVNFNSIARKKRMEYVPGPEELQMRISLMREKKILNGELPDRDRQDNILASLSRTGTDD